MLPGTAVMTWQQIAELRPTPMVWMQESGLADLLPSLSNTAYVGLSAGSMVMAPPACAPPCWS